jgi:nitronate monooxygenase
MQQQVHREALFSPEAKYTTLTKAFSGRLARGIRSRLSEDMKQFQNEMAPFPMQSIFLRSLREAAIAQNKSGFVTFGLDKQHLLLNIEKLLRYLHL